MAKKLMVSAGLLLLIVQSAISSGPMQNTFEYSEPGHKFDNQEFSLDLFGIGATRNRENFADNDTIGFGAGVNYYFMRYLGVSADTYIDDWSLPNHLDFNLLGRYPIEKWSLAPYALIGFGRQWTDTAQWTAQLGGGAEFRMNRMTGLFIDVRGVFPDKSPDFTLWRFGVRLRF
jgi:hypothetical protein